ncbi:hypothetical protein DFJ74DRAFT_100498 [Hyaloraphidium curvatum]|nr:hypothetical protein DFJ74DRAFT_100498 [Hyaloraphidium curvatum]
MGPRVEQVAQLEEKMRTRSSQLHSVLKEKSTLLSQTKAKEAEITELASSVTHLRSNLDKADRLIDTLTDKLHKSSSTARKAEDLEKQTVRFKSSYEQAKQTLEQTVRERDELREALRTKTGAAAELEADLRAQLERLRADREALAKKLLQERAETEARLKELRAEAAKQLGDIEGSRSETVRGLEAQIGHLEEEVRKLSRANNELRQASFREKDELSAKAESYQLRIRQLDAQIAKLEGDQQMLKEDGKLTITRAEGRIRELESKIGTLEQDVAAARKAMSEGQARYQAALKDVDDARREAKVAVDQYERRIRELEASFNAQLTAKEQDLDGLRAEMDRSSSDVVALRRSMQEERDRFEAEKLQLQKAVAELKQSGARLANELSSTRDEQESERLLQAEALRAKDEAIDAVNAEIAKLETQMAIKQKEFQAFRDQWTAQHELSEKMLAKLRSQNDALEADLLASKEEMAAFRLEGRERERRLESEVYERDVTVRRLDTQIVDLKARVSQGDSDIAKLEEQIAAVQTSLLEQEAISQALKDQGVRTAAEHERVLASIRADAAARESKAKAMIAEKEERISEVQAANSILLAQITQHEGTISQLNAEADELSSQIRAVAETAEELRRALASSQAQVADREAAVQRLAAEMESLTQTYEARFEQSKSELAVLRQDFQAVSRELAEAKASIADLQEAKQSAEAAIVKMQGEHEEEAMAAEEARKRLGDELAEAQETIAGLQEAKLTAEETIVRVHEEYQSKLQASEERQTDLDDQLRRIRDDVEALDHENSELKSRVRALDDDLEEARSEARELRERSREAEERSAGDLEAVEEKLRAAEEEVAELKDANEGLRDRLAESEREVDQLNDALSEEKDNVRELRSKLDDAEGEAEQAKEAHEEEVSRLKAKARQAGEKHAEEVAELQSAAEEASRVHAETVARLKLAADELAVTHAEEMARLKAVADELAKTNAEEIAQLKDSVREIEDLRESDIARLRSSMEELETRHTEEVSELRREAEELVAKHEEAVSDLRGEWEDKEAQMRAEGDQLRDRVDELEAQLAWAAEREEGLEERAASLHEQLMEARRTYRHFSCLKEALQICENMAASDALARREVEDVNALLLQEVHAAASLLNHTAQMLMDAEEEASLWREECEHSNEAREVTRDMAADMVAAAIDAVRDERDVEREEQQDQIDTVVTIADGLMAQLVAEREVAEAMASADTFQLDAYRAAFEEQVQKVALEAEDLRTRLKESETRAAQERRMLEQEASKCRVAIQSLDEQKRSQSVEMRKHQEAVRYLEDALKKERQRSAGLEDEVRQSGKLRDENSRLRSEIEQGRGTVLEAERRIASVEATQTLAEQLEQENGDLHNEIAVLNDMIRELEESRMTEEEDMLNRVEVILKQRNLAEHELEKISEINSSLMGHQNARQKIKYVDNLKRENLKLKKDHVELTATTQKQRILILKLSRDLEALKATSGGMHKSRSRSRVGRAALSSRQGMDGSFAMSHSTSFAEFVDGKENDRWSEE